MSQVTNGSPEPKKTSPFSTVRKVSDGKPLTAWSLAADLWPACRAHFPDIPEANEVTVFHELGKALTSSLQLDQVLRTIMEKINEVSAARHVVPAADGY